METKLDQNFEESTISAQKNGRNKLWTFIMTQFKELSQLEIVVFLLNTLLLLVIFGAGMSTMIDEAVNVFPIHPALMYVVGFLLMGIVVMATHVVTKLSAELCFNWKRYATPYKIMLPITNLGLIFLCWAVQSEGGELTNTKDIAAKIAVIESDTSSVSLKQLDTSIGMAQAQLQKEQHNIAFYEQLRSKRRGKWLSEDETKLFLAAKTSQKELNQQVISLVASRSQELSQLHQRNHQKIAKLEAELSRKIQKGRGKAGLAEFLLVFSAFFMMAYKQRYLPEEKLKKSETLPSVNIEDELPHIKRFPTRLSIEDREKMLPAMEVIGYDAEAKRLAIHYKKDGQEYYLDMVLFMKAVKTNRKEYDDAVYMGNQRVSETKLRNMNFHEKILGMSGLSVELLNEEYRYTPMFPDYWISTTETTASSTAEVLGKDCAVLSSG